MRKSSWFAVVRLRLREDGNAEQKRRPRQPYACFSGKEQGDDDHDELDCQYGGGPVGLDTLAASTGEDANTIEDVYEPYLLQLGFIQRTPRGRICTSLVYDHLGRAKPENLAAYNAQTYMFEDQNEDQ